MDKREEEASEFRAAYQGHANFKSLGDRVTRLAWLRVRDKATEMFGADNARLQSENAALREALQDQKTWHEAQEKSLSKQPPSNVNEWRRLQHREQIDAINAALAAGGK